MVALRASVVVSESNEILPKMRVSVKKESVDCDCYFRYVFTVKFRPVEKKLRH